MSNLAKVVAHAWSDKRFKQKLVKRPAAALAEHGVRVRQGIAAKVIENTAETRHLVPPVTPDDASGLSIEALEKVAEGFLRPLDDMIEN